MVLFLTVRRRPGAGAQEAGDAGDSPLLLPASDISMVSQACWAPKRWSAASGKRCPSFQRQGRMSQWTGPNRSGPKPGRQVGGQRVRRQTASAAWSEQLGQNSARAAGAARLTFHLLLFPPPLLTMQLTGFLAASQRQLLSGSFSAAASQRLLPHGPAPCSRSSGLCCSLSSRRFPSCFPEVASQQWLPSGPAPRSTPSGLCSLCHCVNEQRHH
ncbi:hypothetical protein NDU88_001222 [Pleurodeles waltl]|uniref:Uncharacterized protein n=1 Tax=Pleurodeles waltl TaxID=8319 RepID=A0AAV7TJH6_PLEWA|nr:hypothetical protein NDU88_001222 [Pleurodeles waltl]